MIPYEKWLELLAWTKAVFDAAGITSTAYELYNKYVKDPDTVAEAKRVSVIFSTFSEEEIDALTQRMKSCQIQFATEGNAQQRLQCICGVLNSAKEANGGVLPVIDDWATIYSQLGCSKRAKY